MLERIGYPIEGLHSKGWEAFSEPDSPVMDFVFTVCDDAAGEVCPIWPGHPMTAHWGIEDPSHVEGTDIERSEEHTSELQSLMRISYAVLFLKKNNKNPPSYIN